MPTNSYISISIINLHVHLHSFTFSSEIRGNEVLSQCLVISLCFYINSWSFWMVIWIKFFHSSELSWKFDVHTCHLLCDLFQFTFIHEPRFMNLHSFILGSYEISFLQHPTLLLSPVISTVGCCFSFGSISFFFLELLLHWFPEAYRAPPNLKSSFFSVLYFCFFVLFMGFSKQEYWSGFPFPFSCGPYLQEFSTMSNPSWVALHGMSHSFIEVDRIVIHLISLVSFCDCGFHSVCHLMDKDKRLMETSWWEWQTVSEPGSYSDIWFHIQ